MLKGGSYKKDPKTGKVKLDSRTQSIAEDRAAKAKSKSDKKGAK